MRLLIPVILGSMLSAVEPANPLIDQVGFMHDAAEAMGRRQERRLSAAEFLRQSQLPGTVILDARSRDRYALLHVAGAVNLPFTDMTAASLAATIPATSARVLIYCNNNFLNAPEAFASKSAPASLNLATWTALHSYGYREVYELAPLLDVRNSPIPMVAGHASTDGAAGPWVIPRSKLSGTPSSLPSQP